MEQALIVDSGSTAWMLTSTLLVMLMIVPGLALFYGGLVRSKNVLSVMSQVMGVGCLAILVWVGWGYSLSFSGTNPFIGDLAKFGLKGVGGESLWALATEGRAIPELVFACFQMTFAAITAALVIGATVERVKFSAIMFFSLLFLTFIYAPIAHMVWSADGYIFQTGALDFAGGTVVHINAGVAGLVGVLIAGRRIGFPKEAMPPHNLALVLIGTGLLWVGWFGFNGGSALEAGGLAGIAMLNTFVCPAAAALAWMGIERVRSGKPSLLGGASGAVAGLVAITPAAGVSGPLGAMLLGAAVSLGCYSFIAKLKHRLNLDDSLDVFGIHGLGGIIGSIGTAIVALPALGGYGGDDYALGAQLSKQAVAVLIAVAWSGVGSALFWTLTKLLFGLRVSDDDEREGLDVADHGERAYNL
jgi:Amt family ammonium transporter